MNRTFLGVLVVVAVFAHVLCSYTVARIGKRFYSNAHWDTESPRVFDLGHHIVPDRSQTTSLWYLNDGLAIAAFGLAYVFKLYSFYAYWLLLVAIRGVANLATILPKDERCDDGAFSFTHLLNGHCYDKIFSGHFATVFLFTVLALRNYGSPVVCGAAGTSLFAYAVLMLAIRSHYTIDILVSVAVVFAVLQVPLPKS